MSAKVIPWTRPRVLTLQLDQLAGFEGVKLLAGLIQDWVKSDPKSRLKELARLAQLHPTTVSRIMYRQTMSPRLLTCIMIFKALGFKAMRIE